MCPPKPKTPQATTPTIVETPPTPPTPEPSAESPVTAEGAGRTAAGDEGANAKKKGTSALRIDVNLAQPGGKGLNIPRG